MMRQVALPVLTEEVKGGWRRTRGHEKDGIEPMVTRSGAKDRGNFGKGA